MAKDITISNVDETYGDVDVEYEDDDGTLYRDRRRLPVKDDNSPYTAQEIKEFFASKWPYGELEAERRKTSGMFKAVSDMVGGKQQVTASVQPRLSDNG